MIQMIDSVVGIKKEVNKTQKFSGVCQGAKNGFEQYVVMFFGVV